MDVLTGQESLDGLAPVLQEVPAIRHLHRARCALADPFGVLRRAVTGDEFDTKIRVQPRREGRRFPVGQQRDRLAALSVDEDGAIGVALPQGPGIDAEDLMRRGCRLRLVAEQPQEGVPADAPRPHVAETHANDARLHPSRRHGWPLCGPGGDYVRDPHHRLGHAR